MHQIAIGKVTVASAGTPTTMAAAITAAFGSGGIPKTLLDNGKVHKIEVFPLLANTHGVYVGLSTTSRQNPTFSASTGVGVLKELTTPAATGHQDHYEACSHAGNDLNPNDYLFDVVTSGEGVYVTLTVK